MRAFVELADAIGATSKKLEKVRLMSAFFSSLTAADAAIAARFLSAHAFAAHDERTLGVGGAHLSRVIAQMADAAGDDLRTAYGSQQLGNMAEEMLRTTNRDGDLSLAEVARLFEDLAAARGQADKSKLLLDIFSRASVGNVRSIVKIITGDLRIGSKESLVEEAIAKAFARPVADVRRANMMVGDVGETLQLAKQDELARAVVRLFHPLGFMLAASVETADDLFDKATDPEVPALLVEEKYDEIRAQVHKDRNGKVRIFSRTLDQVTEFPELAQPISELPGELILDGEILAWSVTQAIAVYRIAETAGT